MKLIAKSLACLVTIFLFANLLNGQVPLKPLFEEFTSSTCYPCADANAILDPVLEDNMDTHTAIKYQMHWPGTGDIYYTEEGGVRKDYYEVEYAPLLNVNAVEYDPFDMTQETYNGFLTGMTPVSIDITSASIDDDYVIHIVADISTMDVVPAGLTAHVAIVEKVTVGNVAYNGESEFFNVMMKMLPDAGGTTLGIVNGGDSETIDLSFDMSDTNMEGPDDLSVIVFVQDDTDKSIYQSEYGDVEGEFESHMVTINVEDGLGNIVDGAEVFLQGHGFQNTDATGATVFPAVFNGNFDYYVTFPGLLDGEGSFELQDSDEMVTVVLDIPDYLFYDDFSVQSSDYIFVSSGFDYVSWFDGVYTILRQSGTLNPLMLISPEIDISTAENLIFSFTASSGEPEIGFGTIDNPSDPDSYNELEAYFPPGDFIEYQYDLNLPSQMSNVRFAWKHKISDFSWVSMDYLILTEAGVSIEEVGSLRAIELFPNPSNENVIVRMDGIIQAISIYNSLGELVISELGKGGQKTIDVSKLTSGIYSVMVESGNGRAIKSLMIE